MFFVKPYKRLVWHDQQPNTNPIKRAIGLFDREKNLSNIGVNKQVSVFNETIMNIFGNFIQHETFTCNNKYPPWRNKQIKALIAEKNTIQTAEANVNPFHATGLFLYPLKTSESHRFSDVFRGYRKRPVKRNELIFLFDKRDALEIKLQSSINFSQFQYYIKISKKLSDPSTISKCYWTLLKTVKQEKNSPYSTFFHDNILPTSRKRAKSLKKHSHGEVICDN